MIFPQVPMCLKLPLSIFGKACVVMFSSRLRNNHRKENESHASASKLSKRPPADRNGQLAFSLHSPSPSESSSQFWANEKCIARLSGQYLSLCYLYEDDGHDTPSKTCSRCPINYLADLRSCICSFVALLINIHHRYVHPKSSTRQKIIG